MNLILLELLLQSIEIIIVLQQVDLSYNNERRDSY